MRHVLLALALALPALVVLAPASSGASKIDPDAWEAEVVTAPIGQKSPHRLLAFYSDVAWRPNGDYALIVGGVRGPTHNPCQGWSLIMSYDGEAFRVLYNQSGCMLTRLDWHPDSSHAIVVGERNTILKFDATTEATTNVWASSTFAAAGEQFLPRNVAYRPNGEYALITGNDVLRFYPKVGDQADVLAPGAHHSGDFYDAVAWSPDSRYAILEAGIQDRNGTRALGAVAFWSEDEAMCKKNGAPIAPCLYPRVLYGRYDPGFTDIDGITFSPAGKAAWIYGLDGGLGTIMRYLEQEDVFNFPFSYENKGGRLTSMSFQPNAFRVLYTGEGNEQLVMSQSWKFQPLLNNAKCEERWPQFFKQVCPNLKDAAWHPDGRWALLISGAGWIFKFEPKLFPTVEVLSPHENGEFTGNLSARGRAHATQLSRNLSHVEVRIDNGSWTAAHLHSRVLTQAQWNLTVPLAALLPGSRHTFEVRASEDGGATWGPSSSLKFYVKVDDPTRKHRSLQLAAPNGTTVKNGFNLTWDRVLDAHYVIERAAEPTFLEPTSLSAEEPRIRFPAHAKGDYWFRVAAKGGFHQGDWSNTIKVTVTEGPDPSARGATGVIPAPDDGGNVPPPNVTDDSQANRSGTPRGEAARPWLGIPLPEVLPLAAGGLAAWAAGRRRGRIAR